MQGRRFEDGPGTDRPVRARRSLSQNWLIDANLARKLVDALSLPRTGACVLEIGPGTGALTGLLLERAAKVVAVEKDRQCVDFLTGRFGGDRRLRILHADILELSLSDIGLDEGTFLISNLPYALTSPILFHLIESRFPFSTMVLTMQREVALRLTASPGGRQYGRLSVMLSLYGNCERLFDLPPSVFRPMPSVHSSALRVEPVPERWPAPAELELLSKVVKAAFSSRRKTLARSLSIGLSRPVGELKILLSGLGLDPARRAETLSPDEFARMTRAIFPSIALDDD